MNYNKVVDNSIVKAPKVRRSIIDIPFKSDLTCELGKLIPVYQYDVVPGTSIKMKALAQVRTLNPFKVPNFDNLVCEFFWWFTPYRICWAGFQRFLSGSNSDDLLPNVDINLYGLDGGLPVDWSRDAVGNNNLINIDDGGGTYLPCENVTPGSIWDYMGVPVPNAGTIQKGDYYIINNALPFMAYNLIWNENFRDENLMDQMPFGFNQSYFVPSQFFSLLPVCKKRDLFSTSLIKPQKGNAVSISLGSTAPVVFNDMDLIVNTSPNVLVGEAANPIKFANSSGISPSNRFPYFNSEGTLISATTSGETTSTPDGLHPTNLFVDPSLSKVSAYADLSQAQAVDISQLRTLVQAQKYLEMLAIGGTRYDEYLEVFYGVSTGDRSLQKPEFLGSAAVDLNIQEVVKTASEESLGFTGARSNSVDSAGHWTKSFTEYGIVQCFMCIRQKYNTYQQGLNPMLDIKTRLDFHNPVFNYISYQPLKNKLIYMTADNQENANEEAFGFQEPWQRYKSMPNQVHGDLLSNAGNTTLDYWNMADYYAGLPHLGSDWIKSTDVNLKRALLIPQGETAPVRPFVVNFRAKARTTLPIPVNSIPGLMDHIL